MPKFHYIAYMNAPVCNDAGNITEIVPDDHCGQYMSPIVEMICDGRRFFCDTKRPIFIACNFVFFDPDYREDEEDKYEERILPCDVMDGQELDIKPYIHYTFTPNKFGEHKYLMRPICTDPRVLSIIHRSWFLPKNPEKPTQEDLKNICHIPTREDAITYLKKVGYWEDCWPVEWIDTYIRKHHPEKFKAAFPWIKD